jgi:hypothetical protein
MYLCALSASSGPKRIFISLMHYTPSFIPFLCAAHHLAGFYFKMTYRAKILCGSGICNSNYCINIPISAIPSYQGGSHSSMETQHKDRFIRAHHLVYTSCIFCCQFSRLAFEYDVNELILLQFSAPSVVGLT